MGDFDIFDTPQKPAAKSGGDFADFDQPVTPSPKAEEPGFFARGWNSIRSGASDIKHVIDDAPTTGSKIADAAIGMIPGGTGALRAVDIATHPEKRRELERGVDSMVTLGYGQKAARAAEDTNFGRAMNKAMRQGDKPPSMSPEQEQADQEAAPGYRTAGQLAGLGMPGAASYIGKQVAPVVGALGARAGIPAAVDAVAAKAASVPVVGRTLSAATKATAGAGGAVAHYEAAAPAISALSADAEGHRLEAAEGAATDPTGLLLSGAAGAAPHVVAPLAKAAGKVVTDYVAHAPEAADAWVIKDLRGQSKGETTPTARKYLAADEADVQATLKRDPALAETLREARHSDRKKLEAAAAALDSKISEVNTPRADLYDEHVDAALGGGIRAGDFVEKLRAAAEEKRADGTPGGHKMADYLDARAATLEKSKNWGAESTTEPARELSPEMADQLHQLQKVRPNIKDPVVLAQLDEGIAKLQGGVRTTSKFNPDARVPARTARKVVTDIQNAAYDGLGGLADTRAAGQAREGAHDVSNVFNGFLDEAAAKTPEAAQAVEQIRDINTQHSALMNIQKVIEQRLGKATENASGAGGPMAAVRGVKHLMHGSVPFVAYEMANHGHPIMAAATLGAAAAPEIKRFVDTKAAKLAGSPGYKAAVERVARAAKKATVLTDFVREASAAGLPVAEARRIYLAAHPADQERDTVAAGATQLADKYRVAGDAPGLIEPGNIDLTHRPDVANADGSHSSVRSMSFEDNGQEILVPTVPEDGSHIMTDDEAIEQYRRTGKHLGKFKTPDAATRYAERLHEQQAGAMHL